MPRLRTYFIIIIHDVNTLLNLENTLNPYIISYWLPALTNQKNSHNQKPPIREYGGFFCDTDILNSAEVVENRLLVFLRLGLGVIRVYHDFLYLRESRVAGHERAVGEQQDKRNNNAYREYRHHQ